MLVVCLIHYGIGLLCGVMIGDGHQNTGEESEYANALNNTNLNNNSFAAANSTSRLSRVILSTKCDYTNRILMLNLKDNLLTDLSCQLLSSFVEKSFELRMLDLRGNMISENGSYLML